MLKTIDQILNEKLIKNLKIHFYENTFFPFLRGFGVLGFWGFWLLY